jgi:predicted aminopeptidase
MLKRILFAMLILLTGVIIWFNELITYGVEQGVGQLNIVWNSRPVEEVLSDPFTADSVKQKLRYIQAVRQFAIDSIGLNNTSNFTTYYNQDGKELLWVVTASEPYRLRAYTWTFPVVGNLPYKGFFDPEKARLEAKKLKDQGLDVSIRNPGGWSTLGWFNDPVLSSMLSRSAGDLASLIIHEMAHATIFVKDSADFNENLASFIGDQGALYFLGSYFGEHSAELKSYQDDEQYYKRRTTHMLRGAIALDSLYALIQNKSKSEKEKQKQQMIVNIVTSLDTLKNSGGEKLSERFKKQLPNNTLFMSYIRYESRQTDFDEIYQQQFHSDIHKMIEFYRINFPFL